MTEIWDLELGEMRAKQKRETKLVCKICGDEHCPEAGNDWSDRTQDDCVKHIFNMELQRQDREKVGHTRKYPCAQCGGGLCELHDQ